VKTVPVSISVDSELVGSGELAYNDLSHVSLLPTTIRHCDETPIYVDSDEYGSLSFCWDDIVSQGFGGTAERELSIPVYVGDVEVGSAVIRISDSYSADLITMSMFTMMSFLILSLITHVALKIKRGGSK
jgi:hypothetical protein